MNIILALLIRISQHRHFSYGEKSYLYLQTNIFHGINIRRLQILSQMEMLDTMSILILVMGFIDSVDTDLTRYTNGHFVDFFFFNKGLYPLRRKILQPG